MTCGHIPLREPLPLGRAGMTKQAAVLVHRSHGIVLPGFVCRHEAARPCWMIPLAASSYRPNREATSKGCSFQGRTAGIPCRMMRLAESKMFFRCRSVFGTTSQTLAFTERRSRATLFFTIRSKSRSDCASGRLSALRRLDTRRRVR